MTRIPKIILRLALITCLWAGMGGCSAEKEHTPTPTADKHSVRFNISIAGESAGTRAPSAFSSSHIETLDFFIFNYNTGEFVYRPEPFVLSPDNKYVEIDMIRTENDHRHILVVLANVRDEIEQLYDEDTNPQDYAELRKALIYENIHRTDISDSNTPDEYGQERYLPMWGETEPLNVPDDLKTVKTIYMLRSLATVTVTLELDKSANPDQKDFVMTHVVIYNAPDKGYVIPNPDPTYTQVTYTGDVKDIRALKPTIEDLIPVHTKAYYDVPAGATLEEVIFIGEKSNTASGMSDDNKTWLVVGGCYDTDIATQTVTWYRLPLIDANLKQWDVLRNHDYRYIIKKVTGRGAREEEGAEDAEIHAEVVAWNEAKFGVDIDGTYSLSVSPRTASYTFRASEGKVVVTTDHPDNWTATLSSSSTQWNAGKPSWIDGAFESSYNKTGILNYTIQANTGTQARTAFLHIRSDKFEIVSQIQQSVKIDDFDILIKPTGDIPTTGQRRDVVISGQFTDINIRAYDKTNNTTLNQKTLSGDSSPDQTSSTYLEIGSSPNQDRLISFDYQISNGPWTAFREDNQYGWDVNVTTTHTNGVSISPVGETFKVIATGSNRPTVYVGAFDASTNATLSGIITVNAGSGTDETKTITVSSYTTWDANRNVVIRWSMDGANWTNISTGNQRGYYADVSYSPQLSQIPVAGTQITMTVTGEFPAGGVRLYALTTPGATATLSSNPLSPGQSVKLYLTNNHTGATRQIHTYLRSNVGGYEKDVFRINQPSGHYRLPSERIVANADAKSNGVTGNDLMVWTTAMGIPSSYQGNTTNYPDHDKPYYSVGYNPSYGGCAAYYEGDINDQYTGRGKWRLPIHNDSGNEPGLGVLLSTEWDGYHMDANWSLIPNTKSVSLSLLYWNNSQRTDTRTGTSYGWYFMHGMPAVRAGWNEQAWKNTQWRARCVRDPKPEEKSFNSYWE